MRRCMTLALTSETISLRAMSDIADTILGQRLSQISGVGRVAMLGGLKPAVRVQADLARLAAYGIAMEDLRNAIAGANVSGPKGSLDGAQQSYTIAANDQIAAAEAYKPIIIAYRNGAPVTIGDVAIIVDGLENDRTGGWYQGTPAVIIDIQRQPGANVIEVVRQIRAEIPKVQRAIPAGVNLNVVSDRTVTIRASVHDVQFTLILSVVLVTLVVLLFLRSLRATLIAGVALPLSLITSFGIMYFSGFSLDNLSLMALTIGTGFVVDDAIVMIENIVRHMEDGESVMEASLKGASEIGFTVISLTVSLIAVFIPLLFMSGLVGRMFREFALTLTIAVVTSAIVSLTLTPMMCSRLLKHAGEEMAVPGLAAVSRFIDRMVEFYHRTLLVVLRHQRADPGGDLRHHCPDAGPVCRGAEGLSAAAGHRSITAVTEAGPDVSFAEMQSRQTAAAAAIQADPDVIGVVSVIGAGSVNPTTNVGRLVMTLKPRGERRDDVSVVIDRLKARTALDPRHDDLFPAGAGRADLDPVEPLAIPVHADRHRRRRGDRVGQQAGRRDAPRSAVPRRLVGSAGRRPARRARHRSPARRPARRQPAGRQRHAERRVRAAPDFDHLRPGQPVSRGAGGAADVPARSVDPLEALSCPAARRARQVPLSAVATLTRTTAPLAISHQAQFPAVSLSFNLAPGEALGDAVEAVKTIETRIGMPGSIVGVFAGDAAEFSKSLAGQPWLILAAIVTIYIVLGVLYESYIHPITILSTLPSAGVGAILALMLFGQDLSVIGLIGIILLMGIVKKNAIMMIDFALEAERHQGMSANDAIVQACLLRFRPIMMTTLAALFGALPLAVESGTGAELRFPLGISIIGGLLLSQLLTLYTTPVIYLALDRLNRRIEKAVPEPGPTGAAGRGRHRGDAVMASISEPFIRRPVGTTLLAIGLFLVGIVAYDFPAGLGGSQCRFSDDPGVRDAAGRRSLGDGGNRCGAAGAAARRRSPASTRSPRPVRSAPPASSCNSRSAATSTAPRATCRPRSTPRWRICRATCRRCRDSARPIRPRRRCSCWR